jgi:hypothetical protein
VNSDFNLRRLPDLAMDECRKFSISAIMDRTIARERARNSGNI